MIFRVLALQNPALKSLEPLQSANRMHSTRKATRRVAIADGFRAKKENKCLTPGAFYRYQRRKMRPERDGRCQKPIETLEMNMASKLKFAVIATLGAACLSSRAATLYQANDPTLTDIYSATSSANGEIGDEVVSTDTGWQFTGISIKYSANYALAGGLTFTIYPNTGPVIQGFPSPDRSNPLFQITTDIQSGNNVLSVNYSLGDFYLPKDFTFTLKFAGLTGPNDAGVFFGGPSTSAKSSSGDDVWTSTGPAANDWALNHLSGGYGNLNAVITANAPEPSSIALGVVGAAAIGFAAFRRQRQ
jgi:hypothetical protein